MTTRGSEQAGLTMAQAAWAEAHGWCLEVIGTAATGYAVRVDDGYSANGVWHAAEAVFSEFRALRAWAGY